MTETPDPFARALSRRGFLAVAGAAGLGLAGCGGSDERDAPRPSTSASGDFPAKVPHKYGMTTIEQAPKRVATYGGGDVDTLLALGVTPVLVPDIDPRGKASGGVAPWSREKVRGEKPVVASNEELQFEKVAAARPDLITAVEYDLTQPELGDIGRASAWAMRAAVGDPVGFAGPRTHWEPDPEAQWTLLVADETGLPALLAILETLPAGHRTLALAEIAGDDERQPVSSPAHVDLRWVSRRGRPAGTTTVLADALRSRRLPPERGQAWGGGEALAMRDVRRHLVANQPAIASRSLMGYWKHRRTPEDVE